MALPATRYVALSYPASAGGGLLLLGFALLLTPTGKLPSPGWRWWARAMVAVPLLLVVLVTLAPGSVDPRSRCSAARTSRHAGPPPSGLADRLADRQRQADLHAERARAGAVAERRVAEALRAQATDSDPAAGPPGAQRPTS